MIRMIMKTEWVFRNREGSDLVSVFPVQFILRCVTYFLAPQILAQVVWRRLINSHYLVNKELTWTTQALNCQNLQTGHQVIKC